MFVVPSASLAEAVISAAVPALLPSAIVFASPSESVGVDTSDSSTSVMDIVTVSESDVVRSVATIVSVYDVVPPS